MASEKTVPGYMKFVLGGTSGMMATCVVQPLDLIKNRMQTAKDSSVTTLSITRKVLKNEGILTFYNGLSAGLLRQATYTTTRLGIYTYLFEKFSSKGNPPGFLAKAGLGFIAGSLGAFAGTPAEVSLIRMTSDGALPASQRRNYHNCFHALYRIGREEGITGLWRGWSATVGRAMISNPVQLASYSQSKQMLLDSGLFSDNFFLYFCSSMISGLATTLTSMPIDLAKTRLQNMKIVDGKPEYKGIIDVQRKVIMNEGVFALWSGCLPYFLRVGPHTVIVFIVLEQLTSLYKTVVLGQKGSRNTSI